MSDYLPSSICLSLGSGGARGFAHVGVLKVLEREKFRIEALSGASMGALIACLYASGLSALEIEKLVLKIDWKKWLTFLDLSLPKRGFLKGDRIENFLRDILGDLKFEDLKIPLCVTATNLETGQAIALKNGSVVEAVRASISIPGIFQPKEIEGQFLIDGGLSDPVPVYQVRQLSKASVIAVDVTTRVKMMPRKSLNGVFLMSDTLLRSLYMMESRIAELTLLQNPPDYLIRPSIDHVQLYDFRKAKESIEIGEKSAQELVDQNR